MRMLTIMTGLGVVLLASGCATRAPVATADTGPAAPAPGWERECGTASFYGDHLIGRETANGEIYDARKATAAHRTLPFGTVLKVRKTSGGPASMVRVNDRGPFVAGRIIDVSRLVAEELGIVRAGVAEVCIERVDPDS